jgi:hypothetical protein
LRDLLSSGKELLPYIPPALLKSVVFLGYKDKDDEFRFLGSAFWVARLVVDKFDQPHRLAYLVTAAHNVQKAKEESVDDSVWLRVNMKGNGPQWVASTHTNSFATSKDQNVDVAVLKIPIEGTWDNVAWPLEQLVENDLLDTEHTGDRKIELGDELIFAGLFYPHEGKERNIPLVRIGNVAALRGEPVLSRDGRPMDLYLIESHSIGGLSGAPVFMDIATAKLSLPPTYGYMAGAYSSDSWSRFKLFGIVHGHFGIEDILEDAVVADGRKEKLPINFGISMVIPAEKISDVIKRFREEETLELSERPNEKNTLLIMRDSAAPNISFQETGTGFELPTRSEDQFLRDPNHTSRKKE